MSSGSLKIMTCALYTALIAPSACGRYRTSKGAMYKHLFSLSAAICALVILSSTIPTIQGVKVEDGIHGWLPDAGTPSSDHGDAGVRSTRRLLIGSTAPVCTFNECRGCKTRCKAEQVPVDANDPLNSAYHYRCVCRK